jgi:hypothetical protein
MERTSKLLGITMFDLASYAGQKTEEISFSRTMDIHSRIKLAEDIFK